MPAKLKVDNLYKVFGDDPDTTLDMARRGLSKDEIFSRTGNVVAVNDVSFQVNEGQIFVVMGLSGSGKSTLVRCINRLIEPTGGKVILDDTDITGASYDDLRQIRLNRVSMVFQHFALFPHRTVSENVEYGLKTRGMPKAERRDKAMRALKRVGLDSWADAYPSNLSGGMQQRVGLARGLAVEPEVLLMDEPFSALDPLIRRDVQDELLKIQDDIQTTIVFITHDLQEALKLGDQIAIMKDGRFVQIGMPEEIVTAPADEYVSAFTRDVDRSRVLTLNTVMKPASPLERTASREVLHKRFEDRPEEPVFVTDDAGMPVGVILPADVNSADGKAKIPDLMSNRFATARTSQHIVTLFDCLGEGLPIAVIDGNGKLIGQVAPATIFPHLESPGETKDGGPRAAVASGEKAGAQEEKSP